MHNVYTAIFKMSLQGSIIFSILFLTRLLFQKLRISYKYIVGLWFILFFYLAVPWKINLPVGFWNHGLIHSPFPESVSSNILDDTTHDYAAETDYVVYPSATDFSDISEKHTASNENNRVASENIPYNIFVTLWNIFPYVSCFITLILLGHFAYSYYTFRKKLLLCVPYLDNIYFAEEITSPMVYGVLFPKIFLPINIDQNALPYAVAHEKVHIQRKDYLWKVIAYSICLIHWFNPFVWFSYSLLGKDIEKACDEEVIKNLSTEEKKQYAYALLQAASGTLCHTKNIFAAPVCFQEGDVKARIKNILDHKCALPIVAFLVTAATLILALLFLTSTDTQNKPMSEASTEVETISETSTEDDIVREEFNNLLGYNGYYILDKTTVPPWSTYYYAVEEEETFLIATSWGMERDDHIIDIDGNGVQELICNVVYGDGGQDTLIYRRQGSRVLCGSASDMLDEPYDNIHFMCMLPIYIPEENVVEISYYRADLDDMLSKKYKIDFEKIIYWEEVYPGSSDSMPE